MPAFNAALLGYLMYRSGLVPRLIPAMGLIGAPLLASSTLGMMFGVNERGSPCGIRTPQFAASTWWARANESHDSPCEQPIARDAGQVFMQNVHLARCQPYRGSRERTR